MKTMLRNLLVFLAILSVTSAAPAAVLFTETFAYPNGALRTVSGGLWTRYGSDFDSMSDVAVSNERITLQHACNGGPCGLGGNQYEDLKRAFPAVAAGQTIYAGFDVSANNPSFNGIVQSAIFAHFLAGSSYVNRLWATPFSGSDFTLAIGNGSSGPAVSWPSGLTNNTTYRVVLSYEFDSGTSKLWIDPANQTSASISFTDVASLPISAFAVHQGTRGFITNPTQRLDNLVVGTSFNDVLTIPPPTLLGDYNNDGTVDAADYIVWRKTGGTQAEYETWQANFGETLGSGAGASMNAAIPEPATLALLLGVAVGICLWIRHIEWRVQSTR